MIFNDMDSSIMLLQHLLNEKTPGNFVFHEKKSRNEIFKMISRFGKEHSESNIEPHGIAQIIFTVVGLFLAD